MNDLTFLMPCRIESEDRLKNVITTIGYLTYNFPESKIIVHENDKKSVFREQVIPAIEKLFGTFPQTITHRFEESQENFFHKTRILNDLVLAADTEIVYNYDVDHLLPIGSYKTAYNMISSGQFDAVYCYGVGVYQYLVDYPIELFNNFIQSKFDLNVLSPGCNISPSVMVLGQMIRRKTEIDCYMWNENFLAWGPEDCEFLYRIQALGARVGRVNDMCYHLNHQRTFNSHYHNPKWQENMAIWQKMRRLDKNSIIDYYEKQEYVEKRRSQINASV